MVGEAEQVILKWQQEGLQIDVLVVNPPRKGLDEALIRTIIELSPARMVYVSCNPSTLSRDLKRRCAWKSFLFKENLS